MSKIPSKKTVILKHYNQKKIMIQKRLIWQVAQTLGNVLNIKKNSNMLMVKGINK